MPPDRALWRQDPEDELIAQLQDAAVDPHDWEGTSHGHANGHLATDEFLYYTAPFLATIHRDDRRRARAHALATARAARPRRRVGTPPRRRLALRREPVARGARSQRVLGPPADC